MMQADLKTQTVQANGLRIHLTIAGETGPVVLLCHGFPESWYSWRHQMRALAEAGYRAVAMDMPGYGRSSKPDDPAAYSVTNMVETCVGVVHALGESSAIIVGHDFGAPVAWTAAWTRPDVFHAVAGLSLTFGARGLACLPGSPFGELHPAVAGRELAGPGMMFYHEYFCQPDRIAEKEAEHDIRAWLTATLYSLSADRPLPPELAGADLTKLPDEMLRMVVRGAMAVPEGGSIASLVQMPDALPDWLDQEDLDYCVAQLEYSGLRGPLNYYQNGIRDWEALAPHQGKPITVPSLFIGGDRDIVTIWSQEAIARADEMMTDLRGTVIIPNCGHWIMQEQPEATNAALLGFLNSL